MAAQPKALACWDYGFEFRRGHGCPCHVSVVCCQVEVSARGRYFVHRSPTEFGVSECDREASITRRPRPTMAVAPCGGGGEEGKLTSQCWGVTIGMSIKMLEYCNIYIYIHIYIYTHTHTHIHEGESNENLKYFLSRNLLNTKGTQ